MRVPLYRDAQRRLRQYVLAHELGPGDPLPPEARLAEELGISRLSLREATKSLETVGVIRAVAGRGLFVSDFSFDVILEQLPYSFGLSGGSVDEVLQVREAMESGLITAVAALVEQADLAELDAIVEEMQLAYDDKRDLSPIDRRFHVRLYEPLQNPLVTGLIELFWDLFHRLESQLREGDEHSVEVHRQILAAIRSGDADQMTTAVREHFSGVRSSLRERMPAPPAPEGA